MDQAEKLRSMFQSKINNSNLNLFSSRVITITSGKGGVGKTNTTINLAIQLSKLGKKVIILDADFGLANIELLIGTAPKYTLADVLNEKKTIEEILTPGPLDIQFISGGSGIQELTSVSNTQLNYFIQKLSILDKLADIILIDTGAGVSNSVMNFIKAVNEIIVIVTPEPTSIKDAYSLIKILKSNGCKIPTINFVINKVDDIKEGEDVFNKLNMVAKKFLSMELISLGYVPYDTNLVKAVKKQKPVMILYPKSSSTRAFESIGNKLLNMHNKSSASTGITSFIKRLVGNISS